MNDLLNYREIFCPVCGAEGKKILYPNTLEGRPVKLDYKISPDHCLTFQIVRCLKCTHVFSSPLPVDLWKDYVVLADDAYLKYEVTRLETAKLVVRRVKDFVPGGRLLDVGCATGDFMTVAKKYYVVEGLEISQWSADIALGRGFNVHKKRLSALDGRELYDVITLWGVIEHFEKPAEEVREIFRLLKPGGIVCLWTGDVGCLLSRVLGRKWWNVVGQHIQFFSRTSLLRLFVQEGFQKEWIGIYPYVMSREVILQSLGRYPVLQKMAGFVARRFLGPNFMLNVALPGEMFAVFRKNR